MVEIPCCPECGGPLHITTEHTWLPSGAVVQTRQRRFRVSFFECESLDPLFAGIGNLCGEPVQQMVTEAACRETINYMDELVPGELKELVAGPGAADYLNQAAGVVVQLARVMGYGQIAEFNLRFKLDEGDFVKVHYSEPYSVPLMDGNIAGTTRTLTQRDGEIVHEDLPDGTHLLTYTLSDPIKHKAQRWEPPEIPREGDIELRRCMSCGGPAMLTRYGWDLHRGVITGKHNGRRMAVLGPAMIAPLFEYLEQKEGEIIPELVVEAERRFVRGGFYSSSEVRSESHMRNLFALRGLGNIVELTMGRQGVRMRVHHATLHLMIVGITQGLYELAYGKESKVEWEMSPDDTLDIEVTNWD